jgi:hypothetical protein
MFEHLQLHTFRQIILFIGHMEIKHHDVWLQAINKFKGSAKVAASPSTSRSVSVFSICIIPERTADLSSATTTLIGMRSKCMGCGSYYSAIYDRDQSLHATCVRLSGVLRSDWHSIMAGIMSVNSFILSSSATAP